MFDFYLRMVYTMDMITQEKLTILTEGAKFDVSCSSSGSSRKNAGGMGNGYVSGCCHSFTPDGRCVSLLKILLSNDCIYDCKYCPNRASADVPRATATVEEICQLTVDFYKRNYIEGLFLSSAVFQNPDYTMERLVLIVKKLRLEYGFHGYIHLKGIPRADEALNREAARYADRMSYNVEFPSEQSLKLLAPQKSKQSLLLPLKQLTNERVQFAEEKRKGQQKGYFLPAGQTTQMIIGASPEADGQILRLTQSLYRKMQLRRVYYSSYVPVVRDSLLPDVGTGQLREHRLYQADWLLRFYGFTVEELLSEGENLATEFDPKCAWALKNMQLFPVEINRAPLELLLRVPGIGTRNAHKILEARRFTTLTYEDLLKMKVALKRAKHFITCNGKFYGAKNEYAVRNVLAAAELGESALQMDIFSQMPVQASVPLSFEKYSDKKNALIALTGQL